MANNLSWLREDCDVADFRDGLLLALAHSGVCVTLQDSEGRYQFIANMHAPWQAADNGEPTDDKLFGGDVGSDLKSLKTEAVTSNTTQRHEVDLADGGFFEFIVHPISDGSGKTQILTTIVDMSEERHREQVLKGLLREVSHRSKNLLAIILSLASQTARGETSVDRFLKAFRGRVFSLSASQDLVTESSWKGARLSQLISAQVDKYYPNLPEKVRFEGYDPVLTPNAGMHVGLAIHELIVNMVNHDELHKFDAKASVKCSKVDGEIKIDWVEKLAPDTSVEQVEFENVFSEAMLTRIIPSSVNGQATLDEDEKQVRYNLTFSA